MSVAFYDSRGVMVGADLHRYWVQGPAPVVAVPKERHLHIVASGFFMPTSTWWKRTGTVTSDGNQMIQGGFDLYLVPHVPVPVPLPNIAAEAVELAKIIALSSSKARMSVHSVRGEGAALATCLWGPVGANTNCSQPMTLPCGAVLNVNSVSTSPTLGDYLGAAAGWAVEGALGAFSNGILRGLGVGFVAEAIAKHLFRRRVDILRALGFDGTSKLADLPGLVQKAVQKAVDAGET